MTNTSSTGIESEHVGGRQRTRRRRLVIAGAAVAAGVLVLGAGVVGLFIAVYGLDTNVSKRVSGHGTQVVRIALTDFDVTPGTVVVDRGTHLVLAVVNEGDEVHDLALQHGRLRTRMLEPGESQRLDLGLVTGRLLCTVPLHKSLGMTLDVRVASTATTPHQAAAHMGAAAYGLVARDQLDEHEGNGDGNGYKRDEHGHCALSVADDRDQALKYGDPAAEQRSLDCRQSPVRSHREQQTATSQADDCASCIASRSGRSSARPRCTSARRYLYPGGFLRAMRAVAPRFTRAATPTFAVLVNGAFLVLVLAAAAIGTGSLLFSLSIAALVGVNGAGHCLASLRLGRYMPGTLTGATLYLPLSLTAYVYAARDENLTLVTAMAAGALGIAWNAMPALYLFAHAQMHWRPPLAK